MTSASFKGVCELIQVDAEPGFLARVGEWLKGDDGGPVHLAAKRATKIAGKTGK